MECDVSLYLSINTPPSPSVSPHSIDAIFCSKFSRMLKVDFWTYHSYRTVQNMQQQINKNNSSTLKRKIEWERNKVEEINRNSYVLQDFIWLLNQKNEWMNEWKWKSVSRHSPSATRTCCAIVECKIMSENGFSIENIISFRNRPLFTPWTALRRTWRRRAFIKHAHTFSFCSIQRWFTCVLLLNHD